MLHDQTAKYLSTLCYRANARRGICFIPISGFYWDDELPNFPESLKLPEEGKIEVYRLFAIRQRIWNLEKLSDEDQAFWSEAQLQAPEYALFHRLELSAGDREVQNRIVRETEEAFQQWVADADKAEVMEIQPGVQRFSLTYDLTKRDFGEKMHWWSRLFRWSK